MKASLHLGSWIVMFALTSVLGGCSGDADRNSSSGAGGYRDSEKATAREAATVEMTPSHMFSPREVTIRAGESVLWKNSSADVHTVTADASKVSDRDNVVLPPGAKGFHSGEIRPGKTWRQTFTTAGTYKYVCTLHEKDGMTGRVIVRAADPLHRTFWTIQSYMWLLSQCNHINFSKSK
jgi:plastocyanin